MTTSERLFGVLLRAFPSDIRGQHEDEMRETFRLLLETRQGRVTRLRFVARVCLDTVRQGLAERMRRIMRREEGRFGVAVRQGIKTTGGGGMWWSDVLDDVKVAWRGLVRAPMAGTVLILTLALGIGANAAVFSVLRGVLLRPLPYEQPEELLTLRHRFRNVPTVELQGIPGPDLLDYQAGTPSLESLGSIGTLETNLNDDQGAARVTIGWVTPGFFDVLRPGTALGRLLEPSDWTPRTRAQMEDPTFAPPPMPVLLSHAMWEGRFGSDPEMIGKVVTINGTRMNVVGVLEEGFRVHAPPDGGIPARIDAYGYLPIPMTEGARAGGGGLALARLADGATLEQARAELSTVAEALVETHAAHARFGTEVVVEPLFDGVVANARPVLWVLFGAVAMVLLIAVLNVANLQLVRAAARQQDFAVRVALGVSRGRMVRSLLTEGLVFAGLGTIAGLILAAVGLNTLLSLAPTDLPRLEAVSLDGTVLLFTLAVTVAAALGFGLAPLATLGDLGSSAVLSSRRTVGARSHRLRHAVIVGELALSLMLVTGAGLLVRSFAKLGAVDPGYDAEGAVALELALPFFTYRELGRRQAFFDDVLERVAKVPGVTAAGLSPALPFTGFGGTWSAPFGLPGTDLSSESTPRARYRVASPGFFEALGARMVSGRSFERREGGPDKEAVVVIDRRLAESTWPGQDAVGQSLDITIAAYIGQGRQATARVIGIVEPIRFESLTEPDDPLIWIPYNEYGSLEAGIVLRGPGDPILAAAQVRDLIADIDPGTPVYNVRRLSEDLAAATARSRFATLLMSIFALAALVLAGVGLYGVISTSVQRRTQEIGVRLALGARARAIGSMVLKEGTRMALGGIALGLVLSLATAPLLASLLFGVAPTDVPTLLFTTLFLLAVATAAAWIPAMRASKLDPVEALRCE
ncbi:MAG: ABC transporter permease [Gemmatimonadota bacterium]